MAETLPAEWATGRYAARRSERRTAVVTAVAVVLALAVLAIFVVTGLPATPGTKAWNYSLGRLLRHAAAMVLVATAVGVSTVLFQTVTRNRILTPSLMGFDALYLLVQTTAIFLSAGAPGRVPVSGLGGFLVQTTLMVVVATSLCLWLLDGRRGDVHLLLLVGIVFGLFARSVSSFLTRLLDPAAYLQVQDAMFASFRNVTVPVLVAAAVLVALCVLVTAALGGRLDVLLLGRDPATALGINHRRTVLVVLLVVSVLVASATALVGPVMFLGLIVVHVAYAVAGSSRHRWTLPLSVCAGVIALVGGETVLRALDMESTLSIVIEFVGGLLFLALLFSRRNR